MKHGQIGYVWSVISKTVFKIFLAQILRKLQIWLLQRCGTAENGVWRPKNGKTVKPLIKYGKIGYIWNEISRTIFEIFLAKILRKL